MTVNIARTVTTMTPSVFRRIWSAGAVLAGEVRGRPRVEGHGADRGPGDNLAAVDDVDLGAVKRDREVIHAAWRRAIALLTEDRVLAAVAEAFEPVALVAERRDLAAEVRALAVEGHHAAIGEGEGLGDLATRVGDVRRLAVHQVLAGRHVDEEEARLVIGVRLALGPVG